MKKKTTKARSRSRRQKKAAPKRKAVRRTTAKRTPAKKKPRKRVTRVTRPKVWVVVPDPSGLGGPGLEVAIPSRDERAAVISDRDLAEAAYQTRVLEEHGKISRSSGTLGPGQTHALEPGSGDEKRLVRKRFSAR